MTYLCLEKVNLPFFILQIHNPPFRFLIDGAHPPFFPIKLIQGLTAVSSISISDHNGVVVAVFKKGEAFSYIKAKTMYSYNYKPSQIGDFFNVSAEYVAQSLGLDL